MKTLSDIKKIAVLGAGTMGPGIAQMFAIGGYDVTMWTRSEETRERAKTTLLKSLVTFAEEGLIPTDQIDEIYGRVSFALTVEDAVKGADFIQETIVENRDAKIELFEKVNKAVPDSAIIASNTSGLNVFDLLPKNRLKQAVIAHWYSPAQLIPLVEVVKSEQAPQEYADVTVALLEKCGKTAVLMKKFVRGYIANRMQMCLNQEVFYLLDNGYCTPEDIDKAVKASFIPRAVVLGLCKRADFGGLDMTANNYKNKSYTPPEPVDMPKTLAEHIERGELGFKSGKGFYDYTGADKQALLAKRDKQLFEVFKLTKRFMDDPV
ncbi:MAG: 3-hydroxyacyl-CoA dehydrogenase family protein [Oscillospiraceae bacterium]|jgi:3-hydroxyacyl-CoA dehydrogenase|nr:3-hydroxyacyl-CoA dehydrogenase family protein [Oscillospiraceae bacterium]